MYVINLTLGKIFSLFEKIFLFQYLSNLDFNLNQSLVQDPGLFCLFVFKSLLKR